MRLIAARGTGGLAQLRAEVDRSLRTRRFLDYGESAGWARAVQPILAELAAWMVRFGFDDQDFFEIDPVRYASALGEAGPPAYRDAVGASTLSIGISPGGGTALSMGPSAAAASRAGSSRVGWRRMRLCIACSSGGGRVRGSRDSGRGRRREWPRYGEVCERTPL